MSHLLLQANSLRIPLADESVQCVVTSPPYWNLRDYSVDGQIGLESTPYEFVSVMVKVFREVKRVMRTDAVCFINLGDSYAASGPTGGQGKQHTNAGSNGIKNRNAPIGFKPKDLCGIPWRTALALQADGWYLRSDIIWAKPNPMPESVTDRPTKSHEYVFLLTKSERYYWDAEAVREPHVRLWNENNGGSISTGRMVEAGGAMGDMSSHPKGYPLPNPSGRNIRTVWSIPTESYPGAHFATFPRKLVEPCIKAGTSQRGACPECGKGWVRESEKTGEYTTQWGSNVNLAKQMSYPEELHNTNQHRKAKMMVGIYKTTGWRPACDHGHEPIPQIVLDPFAGSGTTLVVAEALGRHGIGLDLSRQYLNMARQRIERPHKHIPRPGRQENHPLFSRLADDA